MIKWTTTTQLQKLSTSYQSDFMCFHSPWRACMLSCFSCVHLCDSMDCSLPGSSVHDILQARNTGVGCHVTLQRIFPTQGSNLSVSPKFVGRFFTTSATWKTHPLLLLYYSEANLRDSLIYASKKGKKNSITAIPLSYLKF